jgi:F0F1-type ATP synthase assembly protein I
MAQETPPPEQGGGGDPWLAFGYVVSGVFLYGLIGWLLDRWLGTSFLVAVGILIGAGLAIFQTWARFRMPTAGPQNDDKQT